MNIKRSEIKSFLGLKRKHNPSSIRESWVKNLRFMNLKASGAISPKFWANFKRKFKGKIKRTTLRMGWL